MTGLPHEAIPSMTDVIGTLCEPIKRSELPGTAVYGPTSDPQPLEAIAKDGDTVRIYGARGSLAILTGILGVGEDMECMSTGTPQGYTGIAGRRARGVQTRLPA